MLAGVEGLGEVLRSDGFFDFLRAGSSRGDSGSGVGERGCGSDDATGSRGLRGRGAEG